MTKRSADIEAIYPPSPMQQGLVFHSMKSPRMYALQSHFDLHGPLDVAALRRAWAGLIARHGVLRSLFILDQGKEPLQVVRRDVTLPWHEEDWRDVAEREQHARLSAYEQADLDRGFAVDAAPLMRMALFRTAEEVHRLVWSVHHAIVDGWSMRILRSEVVSLYDAFVEGRVIELPEPPPYEAFIAWMAGQDRARAERYWRRRLEGFTEPTALPAADHDPGCEITGAVAQHRRIVPGPITSALQALSRTHGLTLSTILQGAWAILLGRYGATEDVVFGTTQSGRPADLPGVQSMVGLFINTLLVRVQAPASARLVPWLTQLQLDLVDSQEYAYTSLVDVRGWSAVPHSRPLFESLVVVENYPPEPAGPSRGSGLTWKRVGHADSSTYPLTLVVRPRDELTLRFMYDPGRLDAATIEQLATHLETLLEAISSAPDLPLGALPLMRSEELEHVIERSNDTAIDYPRERTIHELFEETAVRTPEAIAVEFDDQTLGYAELNRRANQLAHALQDRGVRRGALVAICVERSFEMVIGILGILKAGAAYVPLDPSYPERRLDLMLADTATGLLLTQRTLASRFPAFEGHVIQLDIDWPEIAGLPAEAPSSGAGATDLAYVMYTSGSTGRPKGVCVEHRAVVRLVRGAKYVDLGPDEILLQFAPISFDASIFELWGSLLNGAKLVVFPPQTPSLEELGRFVEAKGITTLWLTAPLFHRMVDTHLTQLGGVRQLLAGGDTLSVPHVRRVIEQLDGRRLVNGYGPTENTTFTCCHVMTASSAIDRSVPVGRPISNTTVYLLDGSLAPVPVGVPGELYAGGDGVARGYLNDPELTSRMFVRNPFSDDPSARLYRTGDRARYLADGTIEFLGRRDDQVKLGGFRVELAEIETVLRHHGRVAEAAVVVHEGAGGEKYLVASLVGMTDEPVPVADVRHDLRAELPGFMIPSRFHVVDTLPALPNGKLDRDALRRATVSKTEAAERGSPRTADEEALAAIVAETLGLEAVGVHEDFFDLGGHSLRAMQVVSRVRSRLGVELPLESFLERPTVAGLAEFVETLRWAREPGRSEPVVADREEVEL